MIYRVEEHVHDVKYQENRLCPIILGHICRWKIPKMTDFMFLKGGGITTICDFKGWRNMCMMWYIKKIDCVQSF